MPLYEIVKADGTREKVEGDDLRYEGTRRPLGLRIVMEQGDPHSLEAGAESTVKAYAPGTWLEVWRREGVGES